MTYDEYVKEELEWEKYRQMHPACDNCNYYYEENGMPLCNYWDNVCEDYKKEKCYKWR